MARMSIFSPYYILLRRTFTPALLFLRPGVASARVSERGASRGIHSPGLAGAKP